MMVKLSAEDVHNSNSMGRDTVALCKLMGFNPRLENDKQSREEANAMGFMAEFAVARLLGTNLPVINVVSDGGVDLWFNDIPIDVKFTNRQDGDLIFDNIDRFKARVAVLVSPTDKPDVMSIKGWMSKKEFEERSTPKDFGYGPRLVVSQQDLRSIESLWRKLNDALFLSTASSKQL